jgi:hypothetical protein
MDQLVQYIACAGIAVSAAALAFVGTELRRFRVQLKDEGLRVITKEGVSHSTSRMMGVMGSPAGYAIYVYREGRWDLEADLSQPGYEPAPPGIAGAYEGQAVKKESLPTCDV